MTTVSEATLDDLLEFVRRTRGFDFTGYKRSSLERRIGKRMDAAGCGSYGQYRDHLEANPDEFARLFNTILINVTSFFRDAATWELLRQEVVPQLLAGGLADASLRVWSAGCASGEEAYTIAMVLADALGDEAYRERVKIYATDIDEEALATARQASYSAKQIEPVPEESLNRYFERSSDGRYVFRQDLRRTVIFGRNDLVQDAPISRIALLICRNTLMYFNTETQARILRRIHFALDDAGAVVVGKSEMLLSHSEQFVPVDLKRRVFRKVREGEVRQRLRRVSGTGAPAAADAEPTLCDRAFDAGSVAQVILDANGALAAVNQAARRLFALSAKDVGRPLQDLELSYRPVELRSPLDRLRREGQPVLLSGVRCALPGGDARLLDVQLTPLGNGGIVAGASVSYVDVTEAQRLQDELERSKRDLEKAYEELQSTVEELETTNEELQSTNEELETTNEELQSTNEELETMNEELQSTNEELETVNDELRTRTHELDDVNRLLETILTSTGLAVAVLDASQAVRMWNGHAEELWGLRAGEVEERNFLTLDVGLPVDDLRTVIRRALISQERSEVTVDATDRRGRPLRCRVTVLPLTGEYDHVNGAIVLMGTAEGSGGPEGSGAVEGSGGPEGADPPEGTDAADGVGAVAVCDGQSGGSSRARR